MTINGTSEGDAETLARLRAAMNGETALTGLDENLIHDGAHWLAEGPRGSFWIIRWHSGAGKVWAWRSPNGRIGFRCAAADLPAARRQADRIAQLIQDGKTKEA
jgi:hypothetical protein